MDPVHVPCHGFPRAAVALDVQPPANPVLPNTPFGSAFSLTLLGPFWPLRADIPGVPSEFLLALMSLHAVLLICSHWQEKEGAKQAFPLKLLFSKCWTLGPYTAFLRTLVTLLLEMPFPWQGQNILHCMFLLWGWDTDWKTMGSWNPTLVILTAGVFKDSLVTCKHGNRLGHQLEHSYLSWQTSGGAGSALCRRGWLHVPGTAIPSMALPDLVSQLQKTLFIARYVCPGVWVWRCHRKVWP